MAIKRIEIRLNTEAERKHRVLMALSKIAYQNGWTYKGEPSLSAAADYVLTLCAEAIATVDVAQGAGLVMKNAMEIRQSVGTGADSFGGFGL